MSTVSNEELTVRAPLGKWDQIDPKWHPHIVNSVFPLVYNWKPFVTVGVITVADTGLATIELAEHAIDFLFDMEFTLEVRVLLGRTGNFRAVGFSLLRKS